MRREELRRSEADTRSRAGSLRSQHDSIRHTLKAVVEGTEEVRRTAKNTLAMEAEVKRMEELLVQAGVDWGRRGTSLALCVEVARFHPVVPASEARPGMAPRGPGNPDGWIVSLLEENVRLKKDALATKALERRVGFLNRKIDDLRSSLRASHDHRDRIVAGHRDTVDGLKKGMVRLRAALVRAAEDRNRANASRRKQLARLRAATVRTTDVIVSLREENARLRAEARASETERKSLASPRGTRGKFRRLHDPGRHGQPPGTVPRRRLARARRFGGR